LVTALETVRDFPRISLGEILERVDRSEPVDPDKSYRQLGVRLWGEGAYERETITGVQTKYARLSRVETADVVINKIWARHGSLAVVSPELSGCYVSSEFPTFAPNPRKVDSHWLDWLTRTKYLWDKCSEKAHGTSGKNRIKAKDFLSIEIALPPLDVQVATSKKLDFVRSTISRLGNRNAEYVEKLRQAIIQEAISGKLVPQNPNDESASKLLNEIKSERERFSTMRKFKKKKRLQPISRDEIPYEAPSSWAWARLGEISTKIGSGSTPLGGRNVYSQSGIPFIRSQNVWNSGLRLDDVVYISEDIHAKMGRTRVLPGDILLNITGASIGRTCIVPESFKEGNVSQHVSIIRLASLSIAPFVHLVLQSDYFQKRIDEVQVGISREGLSKKSLELLLVPIPPLLEQNRIVQRFHALLQLCASLEEKVEENDRNSKVLLNAMLREVFVS
jgi:type I restriction enzyme, S subunit